MFVVGVVSCLAALVASAILLVDYVRPAPVFCAAEGGCSIVRRTAIAYPFGVPLPVFGISGFVAIAIASLVSGPRGRVVQLALALVGALAAAALLAVQAAMKTFCPFCAVADGAALVLFVIALMRFLRRWDPPPARGVTFGVLPLLLLAIAVPIGVGMSRKPPPTATPAVILAEIEKTPRSKVTIVDFVDFECPYCRVTDDGLEPLLAERANKIRLVRKHVPLSMHPHAKDAARAGICGEAMGKGDEMAKLLFRAPETTLTPEGTVAMAKGLGLSEDAFRACLTAPETEARLVADRQTWRDVQGHGLPTIFVEHTKLEGAQTPAELREALDAAGARP